MFGWAVLNYTAGAKAIDKYTPLSYNSPVIIIGEIIPAIVTGIWIGDYSFAFFYFLRASNSFCILNSMVLSIL